MFSCLVEMSILAISFFSHQHHVYFITKCRNHKADSMLPPATLVSIFYRHWYWARHADTHSHICIPCAFVADLPKCTFYDLYTYLCYLALQYWTTERDMIWPLPAELSTIKCRRYHASTLLKNTEHKLDHYKMKISFSAGNIVFLCYKSS